jgi:TolA-binding protein
MLKYIPIVCLGLVLLGCTGNNDERLKINRDIANLQEQIYDIEKVQSEIQQDLKGAVTQINEKLDDRKTQADLKDQIRTLRETLNQFDARLKDLDTKITSVNRSRASVSTAPIQPIEGEQQVPISSVSGEVVEQQFNKALLDYQRGQFDVAVLGFEGVRDNFPNSPFTEACHYYLGRSRTETKNYQTALESFQLITTTYPDGNYIRQAMYYEGQCYFHLNQYSRAVVTLNKLISRFPDSQESDLAKQFLAKAGYQQ